MKSLYVKDLEKGLLITNESFLISEKSKAEDKNGRTYYNISLSDKTGTISGKIWSDSLPNVDEKSIKEERLVSISAKVDEYRGTLQLNISALKGVDESEMDDYIESSSYNAEEMLHEILEEIDSIKNPNIKEVLNKMFSDKDFRRKYMYWPAANSIHHHFRSGLIQHVLEMITISKGLKRFYPELNYDVLTAGIILHDSGKIEEMSGGMSSNYTKRGTLIGHIVIGTELLRKYGEGVLNQDTLDHIEHLILSHHGKQEWGSPVVPSTPEAIALFYIDGISSKVRASLKVVGEIGSDEEFGRPSFFLEGARFWKNHNLDFVNDSESEIEEDIKEIKNETKKEDLDEDQMSLV